MAEEQQNTLEAFYDFLDDYKKVKEVYVFAIRYYGSGPNPTLPDLSLDGWSNPTLSDYPAPVTDPTAVNAISLPSDNSTINSTVVNGKPPPCEPYPEDKLPYDNSGDGGGGGSDESSGSATDSPIDRVKYITIKKSPRLLYYPKA